MHDANDAAWIDARLKDRAEARKKKRMERRDPSLPLVDAGKFAKQLSELARTLTYIVEREGPQIMPFSPVSQDISVILRQLRHTYNLILFLNADERRDYDTDYRQAYSFVILPLVRTMIDGFYNCTALLDEPKRARVFRISGLFRMREAIRADEARFAQDLDWKPYLQMKRKAFEQAMRVEGFSDSDLNAKANEWPLLGKYLGSKPDTSHKQMLREFTLGFWKEYSSISHASYDGLVSIFPFIAGDDFDAERRAKSKDAGERYLGMHIGRTAAVLLCLLTELQHFYRFGGEARIDERLADLWEAMLPIYGVKEMYASRYRGILRKLNSNEYNKAFGSHSHTEG